MISVIQIYYIRSRINKLIFLPPFIITETTPLSSLISSTSTSSSMLKLFKNVLLIFKLSWTYYKHRFSNLGWFIRSSYSVLLKWGVIFGEFLNVLLCGVCF